MANHTVANGWSTLYSHRLRAHPAAMASGRPGHGGGPSVRTRVEPEGHRKAPPPVLKAPHREMWGFSLRVATRFANETKAQRAPACEGRPSASPQLLSNPEPHGVA